METYRMDKISFGTALILLKDGKKVQRSGWNGKGMFVYMVPAATYKSQTEAIKTEFGDTVDYAPYLALKGVTDVINTWVPSISDIFAEDWQIVE